MPGFALRNTCVCGTFVSFRRRVCRRGGEVVMTTDARAESRRRNTEMCLPAQDVYMHPAAVSAKSFAHLDLHRSPTCDDTRQRHTQSQGSWTVRGHRCNYLFADVL